jgi:hypothetical protein
MSNSVIERLQKKTILHNGCYLWQGAKDKDGYGRIKIAGKVKGIHQISFEMYNHKIPDGLEIDHICKQRNCWNPEHLQIVTHKENMKLIKK